MSETLTVHERAAIPVFTADELLRASSEALAEARRRFDGIAEVPLEAATPESVFDAWDQANMVLEDAFGPISVLNSVHPEAAVRDAGDRALIDESVFLTELFQNERLFERVRRVVPVTSAQKQLKKDLLFAQPLSVVGDVPPLNPGALHGHSGRLRFDLAELAQIAKLGVRHRALDLLEKADHRLRILDHLPPSDVVSEAGHFVEDGDLFPQRHNLIHDLHVARRSPILIGDVVALARLGAC